MIMAFVFDTYYCYGPKASMAGVYADENEAKEALAGARWNRQHLELLDLDTYGVKEYEWEPYYEYSDEYDPSVVLENGLVKRRMYLTKRWTDNAPKVEIQFNKHHNHYETMDGDYCSDFYAGYWKRSD